MTLAPLSVMRLLDHTPSGEELEEWLEEHVQSPFDAAMVLCQVAQVAALKVRKVLVSVGAPPDAFVGSGSGQPSEQLLACFLNDDRPTAYALVIALVSENIGAAGDALGDLLRLYHSLPQLEEADIPQ